MIFICALVFSSCDIAIQNNLFKVSVKVETVSFEAGQVFVSVTSKESWTLSIVSEDRSGDVDWASLNVTSGTGNKSNIILTYKANEGETARSLYVVADTGTQKAQCLFSQNGASQQEETDIKKTRWLELPAMNDENLRYFSHSFEMGGKKYRNYSFGWSQENYLAEWVAYPLCSMYTRGSVEDSKWIRNPLFSDEYQPDFRRSFGFSMGYERGHQIANADRKCCQEANQQTYFYTNATLQHKSFNGAIWKNLESNLRSAAQSADTLYVVTGCVLSDSPEYIQDDDGRDVPIPSGYFKAALRYHKASTQGVWLGAAFYLDHKTYSYEDIRAAEAMSIDELEEKLGMDFFVNLEDKIGKDAAEEVEAQNPLSYKSIWNISL